MPFFMIAVAVAATPIASLALMALLGLATPLATVVAMTLTAVSATVFNLIWSRDLDLLTTAIRGIETGENGPEGTEGAGPLLMEPLGRELASLARHLAADIALREQERRADTMILERLPDPVVVLRRDRTVSRQNTAAKEVFGADLPALLRHPALRDALDRATVPGETAAADLTIAAPVARELRVTIVPIDPPLRDGGFAVAILSDRTREHSIERSHADFVANVSHELRTPLASLIGFTETLLGPAKDDAPARERFLTIMAEQGARMNRLIDDLLSLSRIEMAEHQAPSGAVDLRTLAPRLVAGYEPRLTGGARIETTIAPDLPAVAGDADQIAQVLQNLLDNAVKYGKEGGTVRLAATLSPGDPSPSAIWPARPGVVLSVTDQGAGIPEIHLPRLTERFYRVDKGRSRAAGGTGLGLAIVRHIVTRHRGQLSIQSEEGKGTSVSVWLPLAGPGAAAG